MHGHGSSTHAKEKVTWVYLSQGTELGENEDDQPSNHAAATVAFPLCPPVPVPVGWAPLEVCDGLASVDEDGEAS